jgi:hypothetical protein
MLPEGFLLVFIKVNSYLGALLFTQVAESFFKSGGGGEVRKTHVSLTYCKSGTSCDCIIDGSASR